MAETTSGIAELIARIKKDGVVAGEEEKARIIQNAEEQADKILADAKKEAGNIVDGAKKERQALKEQLTAELKMAARDFVFDFQQRIKNQAIRPTVEKSVASVLKDPEFLKNALTQICADYAKDGGDRIEIMVDGELSKKLEAFFTGELHKALSRGVSISDADGLVGFRLVRGDENFVWEFSLDAVTRAMTQLVEPGLRSFFDFETDGAKHSGAGPTLAEAPRQAANA
jgi:V/A-type H+-transporting ATPase subunit E